MSAGLDCLYRLCIGSYIGYNLIPWEKTVTSIHLLYCDGYIEIRPLSYSNYHVQFVSMPVK